MIRSLTRRRLAHIKSTRLARSEFLRMTTRNALRIHWEIVLAQKDPVAISSWLNRSIDVFQGGIKVCHATSPRMVNPNHRFMSIELGVVRSVRRVKPFRLRAFAS